VRHDDGPAEITGHREVTKRRLGERAEQDREREPARPGRQPRCLTGREPGQQSDGDHDSADEPVPELDERVHVLLGQRRAALAARPVAAPEAGVREADGGPGADDQPQEDRVRPRDMHKAHRRDLEAADPGRDLH
jgi:hypothetical protein